VRDPTAALLLGYHHQKPDVRSSAPVYKLDKPLKEHCAILLRSIESVSYKSLNYRVEGCIGPISNDSIHSQAEVFNDLSALDQTYRLTRIYIWSKEEHLEGVELGYASGITILHGKCEGDKTHQLHLKADGSEVVVEVVVREATSTATGSSSPQRYLHSIAFATSLNQTIDSAVLANSEHEASDTTSTENNDAPDVQVSKPQVKISSVTWLKPDDTRSSLRGLFGIQYRNQISTLGVIWGKDGFVPVPPARIQPSICKTFLGLSKSMQHAIQQLPHGFTGTFLMGSNISIRKAFTASHKPFNSLNDIDLNWEIKGLGFATNNKDKLGGLCGLKVTYRNGHEFTYGHYAEDAVAWETNVHPLLSIARVTAGRLRAEQPTYIDTVEFVSGEENSESLLPAWPRDLKSDRFLGVDENVTLDMSEFVEQAPTNSVGGSHSKWSMRGFYGEYSEDEQLITQLGIVWGRG
jgi:hypothetical protein